MKPFEIEVQHSAETVSDLTRAQYALSHKTARLIQVVTAVVCLLIGVHAIGSVAEPFNYFFSLYGCLAIVFINVPASSLLWSRFKKAENLFPVRFSSSAKSTSTSVPRATAERAKPSLMPSAAICCATATRPISF